ncbi:MAG: flagellar hook protein FlgE, partial [Eubacterium sp.]|nr:flagellar hook protein FlgE [Eubacterium sp.]
MMRSLWSGVSGLRVHQTKMDVIGNNISNVNTVGFRGGSVNFTDVFYQTTQNASGPNTNTGAAGTNAMQIGLGSNVASIAVDLSGTGATQRTDRGMDVMINGDAFLIVRSNGNTYFTKSGALDIDANGTLYCTTNGASVLGWRVDENGDIRKDTVNTLNLMGPENKSSSPNPTTYITMSGNVDYASDDVQADTEGYPIDVAVYDNLGQMYTVKMKLVKTSDANTNIYTLSISDMTGPDGTSVLRQKNADGKWEKVGAGPTINFAGAELGPDN